MLLSKDKKSPSQYLNWWRKFEICSCNLSLLLFLHKFSFVSWYISQKESTWNITKNTFSFKVHAFMMSAKNGKFNDSQPPHKIDLLLKKIESAKQW